MRKRHEKDRNSGGRRREPAVTTRGRVKRNPDGFGFLIPENKELPDVYLPRYTMNGIMTDDTVEAACKKENDGRYSGEIVEVVSRANAQIVGRFLMNGPGGVIMDESKSWGSELFIDRLHTRGAAHGMLVAVKILTYPDSQRGFTGEVIDVLGKAGDPLLDTKQVLYQSHIPVDFTKGALEETKKFSEEVHEEDWQGRKDLREKLFVTIDGATARDFDDAVYAEKVPVGFSGNIVPEKPTGTFRVWVAIADVSHYVREGTALDQSAYERGTSVYFPDMVVPMLPEKLSNGLCSLNPHKPRLSMVCEMVLDHAGHVKGTEIYEAVFTSHHRMTYGEVEDIVEAQKPNEKYEDVTPTLNLMADIARILMKKRFQEGSLDLEIPESQVLIDASGIPVDVVRGDRLFAHRLIEELMLLANVAVAKFIAQSGRTCLYRVHEEPFADSLKDLGSDGAQLGIETPSQFGSW